MVQGESQSAAFSTALTSVDIATGSVKVEGKNAARRRVKSNTVGGGLESWFHLHCKKSVPGNLSGSGQRARIWNNTLTLAYVRPFDVVLSDATAVVNVVKM